MCKCVYVCARVSTCGLRQPHTAFNSIDNYSCESFSSCSDESESLCVVAIHLTNRLVDLPKIGRISIQHRGLPFIMCIVLGRATAVFAQLPGKGGHERMQQEPVECLAAKQSQFDWPQKTAN